MVATGLGGIALDRRRARLPEERRRLRRAAGRCACPRSLADVLCPQVRPVLADVGAETPLLDVSSVSEAVERAGGVKIAIPVHLYGIACDVQSLRNSLGAGSPKILEDAAQAHLAGDGGGTAG